MALDRGLQRCERALVNVSQVELTLLRYKVWSAIDLVPS